MKEPIKYFSMFSGIGGFEYGMEQSDYRFECVGYSEIDKYARSIYERHYPNHINYGDATRINTTNLPDFEFLVGGFPCQAFSIAGKRKGFDEARGTLFFEIARVLRDKAPSYFLLENVKGLLSHDRGRTVQTIFRVCDELGYDVSWAVYNSKDYGVPQNRERVFIKGYSRERCPGKVLSQTRNRRKTDVGVIKLNDKAQAQTVYDVEGVSACLSANGGGQGGKTGLYKVNKIGNVNPNKPHQSGDVYSTDGLARTLTCTDSSHPHLLLTDKKLLNGASDGNVACIDANYHKGLGPSDVKKNRRRRTHIIENYRVRRLTPKECERLQGFPDNWTKYGKDNEPISDTQRYKCCGNAVTTNVITAIINEMFKEVIEDEND